MKDSEREESLRNSKWFDYRRMSPDMCNWAFIFSWRISHMSLLTSLGYTTDDAPGFTLLDVSESKICGLKIGFRLPEFEAMIRLRQFADHHCLRYQDYWEAAMQFLVRAEFKDIDCAQYIHNRDLTVFLNRTFKNAVLEYLQDGNVIRVSTSPYFTASSYSGDEVQNAYYSYLVDRASEKYGQRAPMVLVSFLEDDLLATDYLDQHRPEVLSKIIDYLHSKFL